MLAFTYHSLIRVRAPWLEWLVGCWCEH